MPIARHYAVHVLYVIWLLTARMKLLHLSERILPLFRTTVTNYFTESMHRKPTSMTILIADDDHDDRLFMEQALRQNGFSQTIQFVEDGEELMEYLRHEGRFLDQNVPWPNLLILDLNMPRKNGFQALEEIKDDPKLRRLPVVVMTTSSADEDVVKTYNLGVNSFVTKPFNFSRLVEMVGALKTYWMDTVKLP